MKLSRAVHWSVLLAVSSTRCLGLGPELQRVHRGHVKDPSGAIVGGAEMILKNQAKGRRVAPHLDRQGRLRVPQPGPRQLRAARERRGVPALRAEEHRGEPERRRPARREPRAWARRRSRSRWSAETSTLNYDNGAHEDGIAPDTLQQLPIAADERTASGGRLRAAHAGRHQRRPGQRLRRPHQRRHAVGRRGGRRRREHAAGLHEPERDDLDLPGLPVLPGHGERDQGRELELRAPVRLEHLRAGRGHDEIGKRQASTARSSTTTSATA